MKHLKKYLHFYLLNYALLVIYFVFFTNLHIDVREGILFTTVDSITYLETSKEFYNAYLTGYSYIRPFLFPLIILLVFNTFGAIGLWLMQVLFWQISINLIFFSVKKISNNKLLAYVAALLSVINFSFVGLTMQCLTEVTTILLVSALIFYVVHHLNAVRTIKFFHSIVFILVLLTVLKPVFFQLTIIMFVVVLPLFYIKFYLKQPRGLLILLLISLPLFYQLTMMKIKYDTFQVSQIGGETLRNYFLAQGVMMNDGCSLELARAKTINFSDGEVASYLLENKELYTKIYMDNLKTNLNGFSSFLLGPRQFFYPEYVAYMRIVNNVYYYLHLIFALPILLMFFLQVIRKEYSFLITTILCWGIAYYIFLTSPVSFGEGDRLVITAMPLWVFLYTFTFNYFLNQPYFTGFIRRN